MISKDIIIERRRKEIKIKEIQYRDYNYLKLYINQRQLPKAKRHKRNTNNRDTILITITIIKQRRK